MDTISRTDNIISSKYHGELDSKKLGELPPAQREQVLKKFLPKPPAPTDPSLPPLPYQRKHRQRLNPASPPPPKSSPSSKDEADAMSPKHSGAKPIRPRRKPVRKFLWERVYTLIFFAIHALFAVYMRVRRVVHALQDRAYALTYYHHHTPELIRRDVAKLSKIPRHLSVIVSYDPRGNGGVELERLLNHIGELSAWCASAGIETLSVYEKTGILKTHIPTTHAHITSTLHTYFPPHTSPALSLRCPNLPSFSPPSTPPSPFSQTTNPRLTVILLSAEDGRDTMVDLTKTLAEMSQRGKLAPSDISPDLVDAEITESVMGEPDLVVCFGDRMKLEGYPPWQIRLSEIFCSPDNSSGVGYHVFLRALHKFGKAQMRFGT